MIDQTLRPGDWVAWALANLPQRMSNRTLAAQLVGLCFIMPQDATYQAMDEAILSRSQDSDTSPDDVLPVLAQESGLPFYQGQTAQSFRQSLDDKWQIWAKAATQGGLADQLKVVDENHDYLPFIFFPLAGGGDYLLGKPYDPSLTIISSSYAGTGIPQYPNSYFWPTQFAVVIELSASIGTGASTTPPQELGQTFGSNQGQLISQQQLNDFGVCINKFKPINWVCRELIVTCLNFSGSVVWSQLGPATTPTSASFANDWGDTGNVITWGNSVPIGALVEHYAITNLYAHTPLVAQTVLNGTI